MAAAAGPDVGFDADAQILVAAMALVQVWDDPPPVPVVRYVPPPRPPPTPAPPSMPQFGQPVQRHQQPYKPTAAEAAAAAAIDRVRKQLEGRSSSARGTPRPLPFQMPAAAHVTSRPLPFQMPAAAAAAAPHYASGFSLQLGRRPNGITNAGSQCYASAILQCLFATRGLPEMFVEYSKQPEADKYIALRAISGLFEQMARGTVSNSEAEMFKAMIDTAIRKHPSAAGDMKAFIGKAQRDAGEYFSLVLSRFDAVGHLLNDIFGFTVAEFDVCTNPDCGSVKPFGAPQRWTTLLLPMKSEVVFNPKDGRKPFQLDAERELIIQDLIAAHQQGNVVECRECDTHFGRRQTKLVQPYPNFLISLLGRNTDATHKDTRMVRYGREITIVGMNDRGFEEKLVYSLYGIVIHMGTTRGGHYKAQVRWHSTGLWYSVNDSNAELLGPLLPETDAGACMFFYERKFS